MTIWEKIRLVAEQNGTFGCIDLLTEECAELIQACSKYKRACGEGLSTDISPDAALDNLIEEIGDVEICIEEVILTAQLPREEIETYKRKKADRALEREREIRQKAEIEAIRSTHTRI